MIPPNRQCRQHGLDVVLQEEHRRDHDVGPGDVGMAVGQGSGIAAPLIRRMHRYDKIWQFPAQPLFRSGQRPAEVTVHRHHNDTYGRASSGRNGLSHRTGFPW